MNIEEILKKLDKNNSKKGLKATVYVPTHRSTHSSTLEQDRIRFKNAIQEIRSKLEDTSALENELDLLQKKLLDDSFIKHQSLSTAIFVADDFIETVQLPIETEYAVNVSKEFMLEPLYLIQNLLLEAYVVDANITQPRLFFGSLSNAKEIELNIKSYDELLELDHEQNQQNHTLAKNHSEAMFHGHGAESDQKKAEVDLYTSYASEEINKTIGSDSQYLVLVAGEKQTAKTFAELLDMPNVDVIETGNIEHYNTSKIQEILRKELKSRTKMTVDGLKDSASIVKGMKKSYEIIKEGRASDLFVPVLRSTTDSVRSGLEKRFVLTIPDSSETLEAIQNTIKFGGSVFAVSKQDLSEIAVTTRY